MNNSNENEVCLHSGDNIFKGTRYLYLLIFGKGSKSMLKAEGKSAFFGRLILSPPPPAP